MTKQEEIREGIAAYIPCPMQMGDDFTCCPYLPEEGCIKCSKLSKIALTLMRYLHSQGVVIKGSAVMAGKRMKDVYKVESLIEEVSNGKGL